MLQNCAQSNCRIIPKKLRDMKREEICRLLADKVNKLKNKENSLSELLPGVRLLYGETPFARTPVMYEPGIIIFPDIKSVISMNACFVMTLMNISC